MKIELKPVVIDPPKDVVITFSQEEAMQLAAVMGNISGGIDSYSGDCKKLRQFTSSVFYSLFDKLNLNYNKEYEHWSDLIEKPMCLVQ